MTNWRVRCSTGRPPEGNESDKILTILIYSTDAGDKGSRLRVPDFDCGGIPGATSIANVNIATAPAESEAGNRMRRRTRAGAGSRLRGLRRGAFTDQPPGDDTEQRADERGDQILEGDFDFAETKIDAEQPEQASADHCAEHSETKLVQNPRPCLLKVTSRPASVPASAPMISQTMILLIVIDGMG
jgi:hypothetical protein